LFPQHERHTGTRGFACSSAVDINVSILGKIFDLFGQVVGFDPHGPLDALRVGIVITVAADVYDEHRLFVRRGEAPRNFLDWNSRCEFIDAILME
jgi:hypothetical protein